jgi:polysaccharide biosynthesis transport protein
MNQLPPPPDYQPANTGLGVNDILFIVFRHKWKIIIFSMLGIIASAAVWFTKKPLFESSARILVKYVTDTKAPIDAPAGSQADVRSPDRLGNTVMSSEMAILASSDSVIAAVRDVTPQKVLAAYGGGTNLNDAVTVIGLNFEVGAAKNSSVIELSLKHPDAQVAQDVLEKLIRNYQRRHVEVHRAAAAYDDLQLQTDGLRRRLITTEEELRRAKEQADVSDIQKARDDSAMQISSLTKSIYETEAALAEHRAQLEGYKLPAGAAPEGAKDSGTNSVAASGDPNGASTNGAVSVEIPSAVDLAHYKALSDKLAALRAEELVLGLTFKEESKRIQQHRQLIADVESSIKRLGIDPNALAPKATAQTSGNSARPTLFDAASAMANVRALVAKYQTLTNQLEREKSRAKAIFQAENNITGLERKKNLEEAQYTYYAKSLEQARLDVTLDATKLNNIYIVQEPSMGVPASNKKTKKLAGGALVGGFGLGFGLAFLLDLLVDPSVKRRKDIEGGIKLPVFAAVPDFGRNGHSQLKVSDSTAIQKRDETWAGGEIPPWEEADPMLPYYEALRDHVVMSYGDDTHKPKIVGLTSCDRRAGVTRLATGLAAALSRDVQRSVLLIGLEKNKVSVSAFEKGRPAEGLGTEELNGQLDGGEAGQAIVRKDLQSLVTTGRNLAGASVVQSFSDLMPRLKVSNYDYIIFDLPPISQTSGSIRLASQMERTLLVVEAERTSKEKIKAAKEILGRAKTQLATVLNKTHSYGPKTLGPEI